MEHVLLVVQVVLAAALIGIVLLQRSETDGFGLGGGGGSNMLSGRAKANLLTRTTAIIAGLFIVNSLALSILASQHQPPSIIDAIEKQQAKELPAVITDTKPAKEVKEAKPEAVKSAAPSVPNADETKPEPKPVKKVKPTIDADTNHDTKAPSESEQ